MNVRARTIVVVSLLFLTFAAGPGHLLALGPAPYPTGPVEIETYDFDPGVIKPGEKIVYEFGWNGIKAARAEFTVRQDPDRPGWICGRGDGQTMGAAAVIYRANDWVDECMEAKSFRPDLYNIQIRESLDYYDMWMKFDHENLIVEREKTTRTKTSEKKFEVKNTYGPVSLSFVIRSLPWEVGDVRYFEVVDGNDRWFLVAEAVEEAEITVPAGTFKALRFQPSIFELPKRRARENEGYWKKQQRKDAERIPQMRSFTLWMAKDPPRPFLKARSEVYFGHVDMELMSISTPD